MSGIAITSLIIKWELKEKNINIFNYYKALIKLRKEHPLFRLVSKSEVAGKITFPDSGDFNVIIERLSDPIETLFLIINPYPEERTVYIGGRFKILLDDNGDAKPEDINDTVTVPPISAAVLKQL